MYENKKSKLISKEEFQKRVIKNICLSAAILCISLLIGVAGYHYLGHLSIVDSIYNASMILAGMGPAAELQSSSVKLFASFYAIYSGIAFISTIAIIVTPVVHRFMHKFHLREE